MSMPMGSSGPFFLFITWKPENGHQPSVLQLHFLKESPLKSHWNHRLCDILTWTMDDAELTYSGSWSGWYSQENIEAIQSYRKLWVDRICIGPSKEPQRGTYEVSTTGDINRTHWDFLRKYLRKPAGIYIRHIIYDEKTHKIFIKIQIEINA